MHQVSNFPSLDNLLDVNSSGWLFTQMYPSWQSDSVRSLFRCKSCGPALRPQVLDLSAAFDTVNDQILPYVNLVKWPFLGHSSHLLKADQVSAAKSRWEITQDLLLYLVDDLLCGKVYHTHHTIRKILIQSTSFWHVCTKLFQGMVVPEVTDGFSMMDIMPKFCLMCQLCLGTFHFYYIWWIEVQL